MPLVRRKGQSPDPVEAASVGDAPAAGEAGEEQSDEPDHLWTIYIPALPSNIGYTPLQPTYEQQHLVGLPYGRDVFPGDPLLLVMSCPAHLLSARLARENGSDVVIWAWLCSEVLARQAETEFPVVYGIPTSEQVAEAAAAGAREHDTTSMCLAVESAFGIPEQL